MATVSNLRDDLITKKENRLFSKVRVTVETAFYGNNVKRVFSRREAYDLAKKSPGTIVSDMDVFQPEKIGLLPKTKVLIFNDGGKTARDSKVRKVIGTPGVNEDEMAEILREAIFQCRGTKLYHTSGFIGLDREFMVRANIVVPAGWENTLYSWLLNFQEMTDEYVELYKDSKYLEGEGDIFIFSNPDWSNPNYPNGLVIFDVEHNTVALLGMRYFGEHKKATLSLAWAIGTRNGYLACHGGLKQYISENGSKKFTAAFFGLSGSGKSTLTHAKHNGKYEIKILHDDALLINRESGLSIALEPSYFDKTQDYKLIDESTKYILTMQNCGATINSFDNIVPVMEDIRNGNGRAIKSEIWTDNRVNRVGEKCDALFWIMKDDTLPPLVKINNSVIATLFGTALATKRSSAEVLQKGSDINDLVFEPFANPFRVYPLSEDFRGFEELISRQNIQCYIVNTGFFRGKKIGVDETLYCIESVVNQSGQWKEFAKSKSLDYLVVDGYEPNFQDREYVEDLIRRLQMRVNFLKGIDKEEGLREEDLIKMEELVDEISKNC